VFLVPTDPERARNQRNPDLILMEEGTIIGNILITGTKETTTMIGSSRWD
jgi:hypothetical protein